MNSNQGWNQWSHTCYFISEHYLQKLWEHSETRQKLKMHVLTGMLITSLCWINIGSHFTTQKLKGNVDTTISLWTAAHQFNLSTIYVFLTKNVWNHSHSAHSTHMDEGGAAWRFLKLIMQLKWFHNLEESRSNPGFHSIWQIRRLKYVTRSCMSDCAAHNLTSK